MFKGSLYYIKLCWHCDKLFVAAVLFDAFLNAAKTMALVIMPKFIIDALFTDHNKDAAVHYLILYSAALLCINLLKNAVNVVAMIHKNIAFRRFQMKLGEKLMHVDYETLETPSFLNLKEKAERFAYSGGIGFGGILEKTLALISKIITLAGLLAIIFTVSGYLILAVVIIVFLDSLVFAKTNKTGIKFRMEQVVQERRMAYYGEKMGDFHYGKEIRNYSASLWFLKKYSEQITALAQFYTNIARAGCINGVFNTITFTIQLLISYFFIMKDAALNASTVGSFTMHLSAVSTFALTLSGIVTTAIELSQFNEYFKAFTQYITVPSMKSECGQKPCLCDPFTIEFQDVSFKYSSSEKYALKNITVRCNSKERIAIIGENGAGKSTFVKLLMRLYKPTAGRILINGIDIQTIDYDFYQNWFAAVFQDFKLFSCSVKDNITFGRIESEEDERRLQSIVEQTGLDSVIKKLKQGLETAVYRDFDPAGLTPSGGEGQKIAIARAAYKNAPIVILDEPTAALDPKAENQIYEQFDEFFQDKCSFYISHRLAVTKFSHRILVFDNAELVQNGSHAELITQEGKYKELYELQSKYY